MESTVRRHRPPAKWLAAATATLLLLSLLPFAGATLATAGPGTSLVFSTHPVGNVAYGSPLSVAPVVQVRDAGNALVDTGPDSTATITLTLLPPPSLGGPGALASCAASTVGGVATFTGCTVNTNSGVGYKLRASATLNSVPVTVDSAAFNIYSGTPTKLVFTTQPGGGTGGTAWATQPVIQIQDAASQIAVQSNGAVTLAIGTNPGGGTLTCTANPLGATNGVAAFAGCRINKAGTGYTLTASASGVSGTTSSAFNITLGTATVLTFTTQPIGDVQYGVNLSTQPVVTIEDAGGNTITSGADATRQVTIGLLAPTIGGPGALACVTSGTTVTAVGGVASFAGCRVNTNSGLAYKLRASATLNAVPVTVDSAAFNIRSGTPTKLAFSTQPGGGTGGVAWAVQPVVQVQDANGQVAVQDSTTSVTLVIGANPSSGVLTCTANPVAVVNGQAIFAGCSITKAGAAYTLVASSSPVYTTATSNVFNITAGTAVKLGFTAQPANSTSNLAFATQPVVAIQDAGGNTITTAPATTVTLAIGTNPAAGTLTCTSGLTRTTVNGVATFSGCAINNAGVGYTLTATASGYTAATSTAFTVSAPTAGITISASPTAVNRTQSTVLTIQFAAYGASRSVVLQRKTALDSDWVSVGVLTTDSLGRATVSVTPSSSTQYRASFLGTADLLAAVSAPITVGVRYTGNLGPRTSSGSSTLARGTRKTYTGTMRPIVAGQRMSFMIYKWNGSAWVFQTSATISANASGQATFSWTWSRSGRWYIRIRLNADRMYATAWTNLERVTIP